MKYEFRKVFTNRYGVLLLIFLFLCNGYFFYRHLNQEVDYSYTYRQIKEMYQRQPDFEQIESELEAKRIQAFQQWEQSGYTEVSKLEQDGSLITKNMYHEADLLNAVQKRIEQAENYESLLAQRIAEAQVQQETGLFGTSGFSISVLQHTQDEYQQLQGWLKPRTEFFGEVELLINFPLTDIVLLFFGGVAAFILIVEEKSSGTICLTHPTKNGHALIYVYKYGTMLCLLAGGSIFLYGTNFILAAQQLGISNLDAPVQSIYGMDGCPYPLTIQGFLTFFYSLKILWAVAISSLFFGICCWMAKALHAIELALGSFAGTVLMGRSANHWLRTFDLTAILDTKVFFNGCYFLNFFGHPIPRLHWLYWEMIFLICVGFAGGMLAYCHRPVIAAAHKYDNNFLRIGRHTHLFVHEGFKLFCIEGGLVILALFVLVQCLDKSRVPDRNDQLEINYWHYSQILSGKPNEKKDAYLKAEETRLHDIAKQIEAYAQYCGDDKRTFAMLTENLHAQLSAKEAFDQAQQQYISLQPGQVYIYETGYNWLYQYEGVQERYQNTLKLFIVCILGLAGVFSIEQETGVSNLIRPYGGEKKVLRYKRILMLIYLLLALAIAYLPQYLVVSSTLGLPYLEAQANSISMWRMLPSWCRIWMILLLTETVHLAFGFVAVWIIAALSRKIGNKYMAGLMAAAILLIPMFIIL